MKIRPDVAELLNAGYGDRTIARRLNIPQLKVARARTILRIPPGRPGPKPPTTPQDTFWRRAQPTTDGHLIWPGYSPHYGAHITHNGRHYSVHRLAFRLAHDREPEGHVLTGCDKPGCVHPRHVEDQRMRNQYKAIFGEDAA